MRLHPFSRRASRFIALVAGVLLMAGCGVAAASRPPATPSSSSLPRGAFPLVPPRPRPQLMSHGGGGEHRVDNVTGTTVTTTTASRSVLSPAPSCSVPPLEKAAAGLVVGRVTAIGDSIMIDLEPSLQADVKGISFDAVVGQQWYTGISEAQQLRSKGQLGSIVVVELGTNGPISPDLFDEMMSELRGVSRVVFVTNYVPEGYENSNNAIIEAGASQYRNATVANWYALASAHPGWLCPDGYHLSCGGPGAEEMAALIARCV